MQRFHDLSFSRKPDGSIRLMQSDCGEDYIIDLHPEQVLFVARSICGMKPETANKVGELERRIAVLTDKLQSLVCNKALRSDLIERCGDGFEYLAKLDAVLDLALEFDGGRLEPEYKPEPAEQKAPQARTSTLPSTQTSASKDNAPQRTETAGGPDAGQLHIAGL